MKMAALAASLATKLGNVPDVRETQRNSFYELVASCLGGCVCVLLIVVYVVVLVDGYPASDISDTPGWQQTFLWMGLSHNLVEFDDRNLPPPPPPSFVSG